MSSEDENEKEYFEKIAGDIFSWCGELAEKGKLNFKITECKDKFMIFPLAVLIKSCEILVESKKITVDSTSRRIASYNINENLAKLTVSPVAVVTQQKIKSDQEKSSKVVQSILQTKETHNTKIQTKLENKKVKATSESVPVLGNKKQKLDNPLGIKKISSFFLPQPSRSNTANNSNISTECSNGNKENINNQHQQLQQQCSKKNTPLQQSVCVVKSAAYPSLPTVVPVLAPMKEFKIIDILPQPTTTTAGTDTTTNTTTTDNTTQPATIPPEIYHHITHTIAHTFKKHGDTDTISLELLQKEINTSLTTQQQLQEYSYNDSILDNVLKQLESNNSIMVDEGMVYWI